MSNFEVPSVFESDSAQTFFETFISKNRGKTGFSQRMISRRLQWPIGYIPDLVRKRKRFSLRRAVQFGRYFQLDPNSFERLLFLSILDMQLLTQEEAVRIHFGNIAKIEDSKNLAGLL